mgnify:CR=1 FL=1
MVKKYKSNKKKIDKKKILKIISRVQKIRSKNNLNWMNILRLAVNKAPSETVQLMRKINSKDKQIAALFKKI